MYYLDKIYRLAHQCNLTDEKLTILRETTDKMVWNRIQNFNLLEQKDELSLILHKIDNANLMDELKDLLQRDVVFDNIDLDDNVAEVH